MAKRASYSGDTGRLLSPTPQAPAASLTPTGFPQAASSSPLSDPTSTLASRTRCGPVSLEVASLESDFGSDLSAGSTGLGSTSLGSTGLELRIEPRLLVADLERLMAEYLVDCEYRQHKPHTLRTNRSFFEHLLWFLRWRGYTHCGKQEIRELLHYIQQPAPEGRWGKSRITKAVRPITARGYHRCYATFFRWLVDEEILVASPMRKLPAPPLRGVELKQPLTQEQVLALLTAAKSSPNPRRDEAILIFLLDTGLRAAELCGLRMKDLDLQSRCAKVLGKGNKIRMCYWSVPTAKILSRYLRYEKRKEGDPLFCSDRGTTAGAALTPSGLLQIIRKIAKRAGVQCGCHDWRRTFAVTLLRNGANLISVQRLMGHEMLSVTQGYLNLAEADIENQHREFSPVEGLGRKRP